MRDAISHVKNMAGPVTVQDLTVAVGVSQRTLEYAFRDIMDTTPASYLRLYRLNAAHRELVRADQGETTVTAIAQQWGFTHPGRFSGAYRQLFGEAPSRTLSRA
jgi:transcriptional regulator GlxA family with amidase domain